MDWAHVRGHLMPHTQAGWTSSIIKPTSLQVILVEKIFAAVCQQSIEIGPNGHINSLMIIRQ